MISFTTAEFQSPLSSLPLLEASLISDVWQHHERSMCKIAHARASQAQSNKNTSHCVRKQEWRNTDCVVVTIELVSDFSLPESITLLIALLVDSRSCKSLLVDLFQRHLATFIIRSPLFTIPTGRYSFIAIFSIPSVARTVSFFQTCSE